MGIRSSGVGSDRHELDGGSCESDHGQHEADRAQEAGWDRGESRVGSQGVAKRMSDLPTFLFRLQTCAQSHTHPTLNPEILC